jgi:hypothetical protein
MLGKRIEFYKKNPNELKKLAEKSDEYGRPNAAEDIVKDCYELLGMPQNVTAPAKGN